MTETDKIYVEIFLDPIRKCADYMPKFGLRGAEVPGDIKAFSALYGGDAFYSWIGLNSPLMYAAHKAAGGMTSVYRQLGIGCERLFRAIVRDQFSLTAAELLWGYDLTVENGRTQRRTLDAKVSVADLTGDAQNRLISWLLRAASSVSYSRERAESLKGVIFEVRQGYKSADSKRQNADLSFGSRAGAEGYLPAFLIISEQVSQVVVQRYRDSAMIVLSGSLHGSDVTSSFLFCDSVLQYSLSNFFERNSSYLRREVENVLRILLEPK